MVFLPERIRLHRLARAGVIGCLLTLAAMFVAIPPEAEAARNEPSCVAMDIPTPIAAAADAFLHGTLCVPANARQVLQVLVPGATYDSTYWDFPFEPETYSYRRAANKAGYATLTIDLLGTGASARPASVAVTGEAQALAIHQVVSFARAGFGAYRFAKTVLVGHSQGSPTAVLEATRFADLDGLVLTGFRHEIGPTQ